MKKIALLLVCCFMFVAFPFTTVAEGTLTSDKNVNTEETVLGKYVENQLIVWTDEFWEPATVSANKQQIDFYGIKATEIKPLFTATAEGRMLWGELSDNRYPYLITVSTPLSESKTVLSHKSHIIEIMYNYVCEESEFETANGSNFRNSVSGVDYEQWAHEYLSMTEVWNMGFVGSSDIKVAIIDSGFEEHIDLENNLDMSLAFVAGAISTDVSTNSPHGNMIAGIIGADYDDGGVNGLCKNISMVPIKLVYTDDMTASQLLGIVRAVEVGAGIVNLSTKMEYTVNSVALINVLENNGILLVTSAGNEYCDIANSPTASGKCNDSPALLVVGALSQQGGMVPSSNYSSTYVDLYAPGDNNMSTSLDNGYQAIGETSSAAAHVTAAVALLMSHATHKTPVQIRQLILDNVEGIDGFDDYCVTGGTLSIVNAIEALYEENRGAYTKGDISGDGYIDSIDYLYCRRICFGTFIPNQTQYNAADVNGDGTVDSADYLLIKRYYQNTYYFAPF